MWELWNVDAIIVEKDFEATLALLAVEAVDAHGAIIHAEQERKDARLVTT